MKMERFEQLIKFHIFEILNDKSVSNTRVPGYL